ncbi:MAG: 3-phosphoserine/phosphohydroxythreonine transaminase [Candidatus Omnitrophica bacterium]|nr:3-phosphoserine/phosphohydroxythreonine transaminase [Candidatus Omnitrophota bacterium]MCB9720056.1 3-phosphoserine/phosphohydroxythreonine transaminase [Candidatus Omnitrophota bacterium]
MTRAFNFSAGPAVLPEEVLKKAQSELLDYDHSGMSVMELSHRGKEFMGIIEKAEKDLRDIMGIPKNYRVLFLQGGASLQFAMIPINLMTKSKKIDMVHTGQWTKKAISEAKKFGTVNIVASSEGRNFTEIPALDPAKFSKDADYFHICTNNTIYGTKFATLPDTGDVPLVADMSSNILSEPVDVKKFGLIFAGAQKNIGPAGLTLVIVRDDLVGHAPAGTPTLLDYKNLVEEESMCNTPPCFAIYMAGLVFDWIKKQGGLTEMQRRNQEKAKLLYDFLDESSLFDSPVKKEYRSLMNVPFITGNEELDEKFIREAGDANLTTLKGHRTVGGMRASIYNAMPKAGVEALIDFMKAFEEQEAANV